MMKILALCIVFITTVFASIIYPQDGTIWKVGQSVTVTFGPGKPGETVNLYFEQDRSASLGGGPIDQGGSFTFTVPQKAINSAGGSSQLVAVHRVNRMLDSVDNINVQIVK